MSEINNLSKTIAEIVKESQDKGTEPYDTSAEVVRVEDGTAWVHIPGGVDETPAKLTMNASAGDTVQVRVAGGAAWITGNASAPPTDDTTAIVANQNAQVAHILASEAQISAERAHVAADSAVKSAALAKQAADNAEESAIEANLHATGALNGLATVEKVVDVLTWIAEHGEYAATTDSEVQEGKTYFKRSGAGTSANPYVYTPIDNPTGNPASQGWYELTGVDEAVTNYVSTHLALLDDGLYVTLDNTGYKVRVSNTAVEVINNTGQVIATYSAQTTIGSVLSKNVHIDSSSVKIRSGTTVDASFGATSTIGHTETGEHNVYVSNNGMYVRKGTDIYAVFGLNNDAPYTRLGNVGEGQKNVIITDGAISLKNGSETRILLSVDGTTPYVRVGQSGEGQKNMTILDTSVNLRNGQDVHLQLSEDTTSPFVRVGQTGTGQNNMIIRPNGVYQRTGTTANASFTYDSTNNTPQITLGRTGTDQRNVYITNNTIDFREGTNTRLRMAIDGTTPFVRIGNVGTNDKNVIITDSAINLRTGTTSEFAVGSDTTSAYVRIGRADGMRTTIRPTSQVIGSTGANERNMYLTTSALQMRSGTTVDASFGYNTTSDTPQITLGRTDQKNLYITNSQINLRNGTTSEFYVGSDTTSTFVRIGESDGMRTVIRPTQMSIGKVETGKRNLLVTDSALSFRTGTTVDASFGYDSTSSSPVITLGGTGTGQSNVYITNEAMQVRYGTMVIGTFTSNGDVGEVAIGSEGTKARLSYKQSTAAGSTYEQGLLTLGNALKLDGTQRSAQGTVTHTVKATAGASGQPATVTLTVGTSTGTNSIKFDENGLTYGTNNSSVGTVLTGSLDYVSIASGTAWTKAHSLSLPKGTWVITIDEEFASNTTGRRQVNLSTTSGGNEISWLFRDFRSPVNGNYTPCKMVGILSPTATTTYYINVMQNSGSSLQVGGRWEAVRIL